MDALAIALDPASAAAVAAAVTVGATAFFCTRKRKFESSPRCPPKPMLKPTVSGDVTDEPLHDAKRARVNSVKTAAYHELSIAELMKQRAIDMPDKVVYTFLDDRGRESVNLTFGDIDRAARGVAATLQKDANLQKGDRVMLAYPPGLDFALGFWGCLYAGATAVPVYPPYPGTLAKDLPKFNRMVADSGAKVILTNRAYYMATQLATAKNFFANDAVSWPKDVSWVSSDAVADSMAEFYTDVECSFDDLAFFQYSSGSTSEPKAVMVSYGNVNAQLKVWAAIRETDTMVSWVPSYHDMGLVVFILAPASTGARCVSMSPLSFIKDPSLWMRTASKYKATQICAPNFGYALAARKTTKKQVADLDLTHLRQCLCAAEPIRIESLNAFTETFAPAGFNPKTYGCGYGLAEATLAATGPDPYNPKEPVVFVAKKNALEQHKKAQRASADHPAVDTMTLVGCGTLRPTFKVIIVDPETREQLPDCRVGEIWIQGESVTKGYWNREQYTKEQFQATVRGTADTPENHYLRSGDMGFFDGDVMYVTSRLKDLIIIRGRNVCPQDVERTTELAHDEVRPGCVAAFSIETSNQEEALVVVAEMRSDLKKDQDKLRAIANAIATSVLSEHQLRCASIVLLRPRSIPKTTSGKIQRRGTKAKFEDNTLAAQYIHKGVIESRPKAVPVAVVVEPDTAPAAEAADVVKTPAVVKTPEEIVAWLLERLAQETSDSSDEYETSSAKAPTIDADTPWACVGMDSVAIVGLSAELGEFLGCVVPPSAFFQFDTPVKLANAPGLATGELETQESTLPEGSYVDENGEIKAECYDFECFPEVQHLRGQLSELTDAGLVLPYLDVLTAEKKKQLNFNTYNYLGYASHPATAQASKDAIDTYGTGMSSSPIVGQNIINTQLEAALCKHFDAEASVLFVGGWVTNVTTIAALVGKGDLILCDILNHNSCVNGQRLSGATILAFPHNDVAAAERILKSVRHKYRRVLIVIEGVYSMDGDVPNLPAFVALKKQHKAILFVDEAHSFGTMGQTGKGMCEYFDVPTTDVDVRMGTMSKSLGSVGGFILATKTVVDYLKYSAGGFVYSVGLGPANAGAALKAVQLMGDEPQRSVRLQELSAFFYDACVAAKLDVGTNVRGACVVVVYIGGTVETVRLSMRLSDEEKINVKPIVHPAVEEGKCRLRFFISYLHTEADLSRTVQALVRIMDSLRNPDAIVEAVTEAPTVVVDAAVPVVEPVVDNQIDTVASVEEPQHADAVIEKVADVAAAVVEAAPVEPEVQATAEVPALAGAVVPDAPTVVDEAPKTSVADVPGTIVAEPVVDVDASLQPAAATLDAEPEPKAKKVTKKKTAKKANVVAN